MITIDKRSLKAMMRYAAGPERTPCHGLLVWPGHDAIAVTNGHLVVVHGGSFVPSDRPKLIASEHIDDAIARAAGPITIDLETSCGARLCGEHVPYATIDGPPLAQVMSPTTEAVDKIAISSWLLEALPKLAAATSSRKKSPAA